MSGRKPGYSGQSVRPELFRVNIQKMLSLKKIRSFTLVLLLISCAYCRTVNDKNIICEGREAVIEPDYTDVTIPPNIAPMNFMIREEGSCYRIRASSPGAYQFIIRSGRGKVRFPARKWKRLLEESRGDSIVIEIYSSEGRKDMKRYTPFSMHVADDPIDPYLAYRLIYPGYYSWSDIRIVQRSTGSFRVSPVFNNRMMEKNCANCHSFNNNSPDRFMIHIRGSLGGTYFAENGKITRTDPEIEGIPGGATYPAWHPGGRFLAFSSNQVRQSFYSVAEKDIEVFDLFSSLILYDRQENETFSISDRDTAEYLMTFPSWSPDGRFLYFCRAPQYESGYSPEMEEIQATRYNLARKLFDPDTGTFGETEIVFDASAMGKSASLPRISPDGRFLVCTLADYGTFPVQHREADLYLLDLVNGESSRMDINSDETESYHTWSGNGRWLVFSSRRTDGRSSRPFFAYIDTEGRQGKEFILPQKDPDIYGRMLESFNIPEFVSGRIKVKPGDFVAASKNVIIPARAGDRDASVLIPDEAKIRAAEKDNERPVH